MAAIPVTITGTMTYTGLEIGGGPLPGGPFPSHPIAPGGLPPGIWGGAPLPWPTPPIYYPPTPPLGIWGGAPLPWPGHPISPGGPPPVPSHPIYWPPSIWPSPGRPEHPIVLPPEGSAPPEGGGDGGRWAYSPIYGWVWLPAGSGDKPHPPQNPDQPQVNPLPT